MRYALLTSLLMALCACSPTTDITRTSTETFAGRAGYQVLNASEEGNLLRLKVKVDSRAAARTVAEDLAVKKRIRGFDRIEVDVVGPNNSPAGTLKWSTKNGFSYAQRR
jgi:hypothetical protein